MARTRKLRAGAGEVEVEEEVHSTLVSCLPLSCSILHGEATYSSRGTLLRKSESFLVKFFIDHTTPHQHINNVKQVQVHRGT